MLFSTSSPREKGGPMSEHRRLSFLSLNEEAFADNGGIHYFLHVDEVKQRTKEWESGEVDEHVTVSFRLVRTRGETPASRQTFKDKHIRDNLCMSKEETMRAFELVLDTIWAFDKATEPKE